MHSLKGKTMKLYELTAQFTKLESMAETIESEDDALAFSELWAEIDDAFDLKVERTACVIRNLESEADAIEAEEKRLYDRRKALTNSASRLKGYLETHMEANAVDKVKGQLFTVSMQMNPPKLIVDESNLPDEWFRIKKEPDNARIKDAIKNGVMVPSTTIIHKKSLRIR